MGTKSSVVHRRAERPKPVLHGWAKNKWPYDGNVEANERFGVVEPDDILLQADEVKARSNGAKL